ncbi:MULTISPECIES: hypothetical protein [unclassified Streptomyces]|uniref:hypothetical protein n=1 Tax=unclassified Streptomyces TaxID=2593676 RepID=UPI0033A7D90C
MTDYLTAAMAMLRPAQNRYADPVAWDRLHAELGIRRPSGYRAVVDAYDPYYPGPVQLCRLPMTPADPPQPWNGPDRDRKTPVAARARRPYRSSLPVASSPISSVSAVRSPSACEGVERATSGC